MRRLSRLHVGIAMAATMGLAVAAPVGAAAKYVTLTEHGGSPDVHVAPDGTTHAVWDDGSDRNNYVTYYCRMPSPTAGCQTPVKLETPRGYDYTSGPRVFLTAPSTVVVVAFRSGSFTTPAGNRGHVVFSFVSTDGGTTFSSARMIGTAEGSGDVIADATNVYLISDVKTGGAYFQAASHSSGSFASTTANLAAESSQAYSGALALYQDGGTTKLVAVFTDLETVFYRVWSGTGDPNDVATWGPVQPVDDGDDSQLAYGPGGVFLFYGQERDGVTRYVVRHFDGEGFGDPVHVGEPNMRAGDFFQDSSGRLHLLWHQFDGGLVYRTSMDGVRWSPRLQLTPDEERGLSPAAHSNADGVGRAVWTKPGSLSNSDDHVVRSTVLAGRCALAVQGTAAAETLTGGNLGETIFGLGGNDRLDGGGGSDCLFGAAGNDTITGGGARDTLVGGAGDDVLLAKDGVGEVVNCGPGGRDRATVDRTDRVKGCETVRKG